MTSRSKARAGALACLTALACSACGTAASVPCEGLSSCVAASAEPEAGGSFRGRAGSDVGGAARLLEDGSGVYVTVVVQGVAAGAHALHIHEKGDCSAPDFASAGAHFDPTGAPHACPPDEPRHAGDLGNLQVGSDGTGLLQLHTSAISLQPGPSSVRGLAIILRDTADDCATQPFGGTGENLACAILAPSP
jgi:Cu-Zn family superoxide dismutase